MNEELRIVIRAITEEAERSLQDVREELAEIGETSREASRQVDEAFRAIGKSAAVAVAAIAAVATAIISLGKRSVEFQKTQAKLNAGFESAGSSAAQAAITYKDLFGFLGESDRAAEAANHLAQLTTNEQELAEWTNILQGAYATFGESLPVEGLAEAANEAAKTGVVVGNLADALNWMGVSEDAVNASLASLNSTEERAAYLRDLLNGLYGSAANIYGKNNKALIEYNKSQANLDIAMANASNAITPLLTSINDLGATFLTSLAPAIEVVSIYLTAFIQLIAEAIQWVGSFFGLFGSSSEKATADVEGYRKAMSEYIESLNNGINGANDDTNKYIRTIDKLKRATAGFDELNVIQSPVAYDSTGDGNEDDSGGSKKIPPPPNPADYGLGSGLDITDITEDIEEAKEKIKSLLPLVAIVAAAFVGWKIGSLLGDLKDALGLIKQFGGSMSKLQDYSNLVGSNASTMAVNIQRAAGYALIAAGAFEIVFGFSDAWVNGIDWKNFATVLGGIALTVGGLALSFGKLAAGIGVLVGGIVLVVMGIKDLVTNGYSMEAVITIAAGALLVLVGVCLAFNAALLANPITWIIAAIIALVAAFVILWNECDAFREFWLNLWEKAKVWFAQFWESVQPLIKAIGGAFMELWELIKAVWAHIAPFLIEAWEEIKVRWEAAKPFFEWLWEAIKKIFLFSLNYIIEAFKGTWNNIEAIWNVAVAYFTTVWENIKLIFSVVKNVLSGNWTEAWDAIKGIVNNWAGFFVTVWDNIKKIFDGVATFFGNVFGEAWDKVKTVFTNIGTAISDAVTNTVKAAISNVLSGAAKIINGFIKAINVAISVLNAIPGVNINKLSELTVPQLATGGIIESATLAVVGERGKEAVLPLENNTGWMDVLAERIAAKNETPSKIVLTVDGKELGYATIGSINNITRQSGKLQLALI